LDFKRKGLYTEPIGGGYLKNFFHSCPAPLGHLAGKEELSKPKISFIPYSFPWDFKNISGFNPKKALPFLWLRERP